MIRRSSVLCLGFALACACASSSGPVDTPDTGRALTGGTGGAEPGPPASGGQSGGQGGSTNSSSAGASLGGGSQGGGNIEAGSVNANDSGLPAADADGMGPQNLAIGHCYKPESTAMWANDPCNAFDGQLSTATGPAKTWDSALGALAVDLGATRTIARLVVYYDDNKQPGVDLPSPPGYAIDVSSDGKSWTTIKDVARPLMIDTQTDLNASYRYLRLHFKLVYFDPWFVHSIREIEVWGVSDGFTH